MVDTCQEDTNQAVKGGSHTKTTTPHSIPSVLLQRHPHVRETSQTASPAGLGTRHFVRKQLTTPGSATSASSFEEGASYDGFSDAGTPASYGGLKPKSIERDNKTRLLIKQPTKKLSSPNRQSLVRRLVDDDDDRVRVDTKENDLLPSPILHNIVVKRVPFSDAGGEAEALGTSMGSFSPPSPKLIQRIVTLPRKSARRVVIRSPGADGQTCEQVRYVDADGQVVQQGGHCVNAEDKTDKNSTNSSGRATVTAPTRTLRRIVVRRTGADGQVLEDVQFVDNDGNVVETEGGASNVKTSIMTLTPTIARRVVIPGKLTRRIVRRTDPDGQVHVQVQYVDVDGNIVRTEGGNRDHNSRPPGAAVTRRSVTPGKATRRVVVRKTELDGQVHEEVQYMDADDNVVQSDGNALGTTSISDTSGPSSGRTTVTRRIVSPGHTWKQEVGNTLPTGHGDCTSGSVEQHMDWDGQIVEDVGRALSSAGSFSGSVSSATSDTSTTTSCRRIVTRRVMASPNTAPIARRSVVHRTGSSSDAEYEEDVQYVESEDGDSTRIISSQSSPGRRVLTRRIVTPQRVVRRMVVHKDTKAVDRLDIDADFVRSEGNASSDESVGDSSRGGYSVSDQIVIPRRTRRVTSRTASPSDTQQKKVDDVVTVNAHSSKKLETTANLADDENKASNSIVDTPIATVVGDNHESPKVSVAATMAGAAVMASAIDGDSSSPHNEIKTFEEAFAASSVANVTTTVTQDIAGPGQDRERLHVLNTFGTTETKTTRTDAPFGNDKTFNMSKTAVATHKEELVSAPEAAKADASRVVAKFHLQSEPTHSLYEDSNVVAENPRDSDAPETSSVTADEMAPPSIMASTEEASEGGRSSAFFKSDDKLENDSDNEESVHLVSMQTEKAMEHTEGAAPATTMSIVDAPVLPNVVVKTPLATRAAYQELRTPHEKGDEKSTAFCVISTSDEDKAPVLPAESVSVEVLGPQAATKLAASPASSGDNDLSQTGAEAVAVEALDQKMSGTCPSTHLAKTEMAATIDGIHDAIATTEEGASSMSLQKDGRSIWKFWGALKSRASLREDVKLSDEGERGEGCVATGTEMTDKIELSATRDQGAVRESPRGSIAVPAHTTIEVEKGFDSGHLYHDTAAAPALDNAVPADVVVVPESYQQEQSDKFEREELMKATPEQAGGLLGSVGMKDKPEQSAAVMASVCSGLSVGWAIKGEDNKKTRDSITQNDNTAAVIQVESIRHCIQSESILTNAAATVSSSGKTTRDSERRATELVDGIEPDNELDEHYVKIASPRRSRALDNDEGLWTVKPCLLAWSKLCLTRKSWKTFSAGTALSGNDQMLLENVSGSVKPGEFLVITGPSRDESRALLSCLAGFEDDMEGNVTVNGRAWNEKTNRYIGYVMHEDLFYETLTVHEHLIAQAHLRMRRTHTDEMCLKRVEHVMEEIGLTSCRNKLIGGGIVLRGITRGERKLLALATALLTNPSILLVEEPTGDLDTVSAEIIVAKLRWLAFEKGLTVAVTLHHPSSHFYGLFDVLYLVADASCVYDGKAANCVAYFSTIGYECPKYMSPMDYFLLQMVVGDRECDDEGVAPVDTLKREWAHRNAASYTENAARGEAMSEDVVVDEYGHKNRYYHMGCCSQLWLLWARHIRRLSRYGFVFQWHLLAALLIGVVFGLVYLQIDLNDQHGIQNLSGAFFYVVVVQMLFVAYRTFVFMPRETAIALRERQEYRGGWYNLLCWYLTKIAAELPALIILSIVLFVPVFLLVGIGHGFKVYVYMQIVMVLAGWTAVGLAFAALGALRHVTLALIVYTVLLVLFGAFGGLLINVADIPDWFLWLHYLSPIKYSYESMMKIFWKRVDNIGCDTTLEGCIAFTGDGVLRYYSMEKRSALGDTLILLVICLSLFFVAFWFLLALANKRISGLQWRYDWDFKGPLGHRRHRVAISAIKEGKTATRSSLRHIIERKSRRSSFAAVERNCVVNMENHYICVETPRVGDHGTCDAPSVTLGWRSLWLEAPADQKTKSGGETKHLLCDASGSAKCGELVLITGPSADSNVALLEALGGLQKTVQGKVTLNGVVSAAHKLSKHVAYVARVDMFYETLTVEEHLQFQAQLVTGKSSDGSGLCCGAGTGDLETERVDILLDELDLATKRHVLIRYLSEADTKLLAVATALLVNPSILLVEEPTHGMDFYASQRVVLKLRQLARGGRTIVVTMTHPSSHLYALFDTLCLLASGAAVYHGKMREAVSYFASLGYQCPQYISPVDYFIHLVSDKKQDDGTADGQAVFFKEVWSTRYSESCLADNFGELEPQEEKIFSSLRVGCCSQLSLLFRRHLLRLARYRTVFGWHLLWMVVASVIFGLIFLHLDLDDQQDIQNWAGAFFFMITLQMLVMAYRTFIFLPREMAIVEHEHRSGGYYSLASWYLTKVLVELPATLVLSLVLFVPAYLLIGIGLGFKLYLYMQLVMWFVGWSAIGLASLLLGLFRRVRVALMVYMLLLIVFVVFGGLLINTDDVPNYLIWLHYISPVKYSYEALMKLFWGRIGFLVCGGSHGSGGGILRSALDTSGMSGSGSDEDDVGCIAHSGDDVLSHYSMDMSRGSRSDSLILLEITLLYFCIGYAILSRRWQRSKRHSICRGAS